VLSSQAFFEYVRDSPCVLLFMRDHQKQIFGGFATDVWSDNKERYYGTAESFVFTCTPLRVYKTTGENEFYMLTKSDFIAMGGGDSFSFKIDNTFTNGVSGYSQTYNSPCLASTKNFQCLEFEVWGPINDDGIPPSQRLGMRRDVTQPLVNSSLITGSGGGGVKNLLVTT